MWNFFSKFFKKRQSEKKEEVISFDEDGVSFHYPDSVEDIYKKSDSIDSFINRINKSFK